MKVKKLHITVCAVIALIAVMLASLLISTSAATPTPNLRIDYCNLSFRDSVCIKYAVASNVSDVKVLLWNEPQTEYVVGTQDVELTSVGTETINEQSYMIFDYTDFVAKQMTDVVYARAYVQSDGADYYSEINKYSILQYAYNKLGKTGTASTDENLKNMLVDMLSYGASAQKYFDYKTDRLATDDFYQVKLAEGLLDDGCNHGLYLPGDQVVMNAPETDSQGNAFSYWADSNGNNIGDTAVYTLTVGTQNEVYTPMYIRYAEGLEFDSNGDGTCYVIGMGTCTDTELVIPPTSPDGDTVIGIDASAFSGEAITTLTLPNTITDIGRRAFDGCTSLTDVYYGGTEEEWANINISTGNTPLENAQIHFTGESVKKYTVTFADHDGTVLKTETVEEGMAATAPETPAREGYTFTGWDKAFDNVTADLTVTAQYVEEVQDTTPTIVVSDATAKVGATDVKVTLSIRNNPGILGMTLALNYDESVMTLTGVEKGDALNEMTFTKPKILGSGCKFPWDAEEVLPEDATNGEMLTLTFSISDTAAAGSYDVSLTYDNGAIIDNDMMPVDVAIENGTITIGS